MKSTSLTTDGIVDVFTVEGTDTGPLVGTKFVVKDLFDVAGHVTGAGNPTWAKTHAPAKETAPAVAKLLKAGAQLTGKSCTDEFAYSIDGVNIHYGIPKNPQYDDRVAGGSSSGSASAVACKLVDFAVGTDTAGSIRVPASYCGIYSFRPTHGRVPVEGVCELAHSLDTVGWFARDADLLRACGSILLSDFDARMQSIKLLIAHEAFELTSEPLRSALRKYVTSVSKAFNAVEHFKLGEKLWELAPVQLRILQGYEAWNYYGDWMLKNEPDMAQPIVQRFQFARTVTEEQYLLSRAFAAKLSQEFEKFLEGPTVLCLPTTWNLPPLIDSTDEHLQANRAENMKLTTIASLAGLPQLTIPVKYSADKATGLSLIARRGNDMLLLNLAQELAEQQA